MKSFLLMLLNFKFRKKIRIFPGLTLNLSRQGISPTIGVPGLSVNKNKKGIFLNLGIPGTGIYNRIKLDDQKSEEPMKPQLKKFKSNKFTKQEMEDLIRDLKKGPP